MMNFDVGMRGQVSVFQLPGTDTLTAASKDFAIKRITMAFRVSQSTGIALGLRPYSSVNYQYLTNGQTFRIEAFYKQYADLTKYTYDGFPKTYAVNNFSDLFNGGDGYAKAFQTSQGTCRSQV